MAIWTWKCRLLLHNIKSVFLTFCIIIAFFLTNQLESQWALIISLFFVVSDYDRVSFVAPIVVILILPKLIENINLWLKVWILTSYIHGLYYPVYGAAVCIGFLPLAIWQIYRYVKSGELQQALKDKLFWMGWLATIIPILLGWKLLRGTLRHMLAMGGQTIYADGLSRFAQQIPSCFLPYIDNLLIRIIAYLLFSYMIPIAVIIMSFALFLSCGGVKIENKKLIFKNKKGGLIALSMALFMLVSFSYTVVRFDVGDIYSRSNGVIKTVFIVLIVLLCNYIDRKDRSYVYILAFSVFLISAVSEEGTWNLESYSKLDAQYVIPENYIKVIDEDVNLGECFIENETYQYILHINDYVKQINQNNGCLGLVDTFGLDYLCNVNGSSVIEIANTIKGYDATKETIDLLRKNHPIVGRCLYTYNNYYLYHWLITSGEYYFDNEKRVFVPNEDTYTIDEILENNANIDLSWGNIDLGRTAGSWGKSIDYLNEVFTELPEEVNIEKDAQKYIIKFANVIDGDEADFIFIDFGDDVLDYNYIMLSNINDDEIIDVSNSTILKYYLKKDYNPQTRVTISWYDDNGALQSMDCKFDEGKLLIPIGAGMGWLLNNHDSITLTITNNEEICTLYDINSIRFLKLREVQ